MPQLDIVAVRAQSMVALGKQMNNVVIGASRDNRTWQVSMESDNVAGYLTWRQGGGAAGLGRVTARLARLVVAKDAAGDVASLIEGEQVASIPGLDVVADSFELYGRNLGRLELVANNNRNGQWRLQRLQLSNPDAELNGSGVWGPTPDAGPGAKRKMSLELALDIKDIGRLMDRLGLAGTMRAGTGKLEGELSWRGVPFALDYPSMSGQLALSTDKGQFLKADPGVAKLLGVLSLQSLPRRIALDFRDVFSEGFAYDTIRANIGIANGVMSTRDFKMKGINATVVMDGSSDLARETQNLKVIVVPELNAGSASLLYALVTNPAIGFGTFIAQLVLREPLMKALTYEYAVTGTWSDPSVAKLDGRSGQASANQAGSGGTN